MNWDLEVEHKACYKNIFRLRQVNKLTDMFDDVLNHVFYMGYFEFQVDAMYTKEKDVGDGIYKQLMKYLNSFIGKEYRQSYIDKYKNDKCVCRKVSEGTIEESLKHVFNCSIGSMSILNDKAAVGLIKDLAEKLKKYIKTDVCEVYDIEKVPAVMGEFFPSIIFLYRCIRIENFVFLILWGTTD